ncbi:MAG: hypothetical protein WCI36_03830 [bacterium]
MILQISLDVNNISLTLKDGHKVIDTLAWNDEYTLSEKLLPNIHQLLEKNNVSKNKVKLVGKITKNSGVTSSRIVKTIVAAWKIGNEVL